MRDMAFFSQIEHVTFGVRESKLRMAPRSRTHPITVREGYILRCEFIVSERQLCASRDQFAVRLELGDHPVADELRDLDMSRLLGYQYAPQCQGILTPVVESLKA